MQYFKKSSLLSIVLSVAACGHSVIRDAADGSSLQAAREALTEGSAGTALAIARGVLASQPNNVSAIVQAGDAEAALGDRLAASLSYRQALRVDPKNVQARLGQGKLLLRDNLREAETTFRSVFSDASQDPAVLNDLGYVLDLQDRHKEAQVYYEKSLVVDPDRLSTRVNWALSLALDGKGGQAEKILSDMAAGGSGSRKIRLDFAVAQVMAGHDEEAKHRPLLRASPSFAFRTRLQGDFWETAANAMICHSLLLVWRYGGRDAAWRERATWVC